MRTSISSAIRRSDSPYLPSRWRLFYYSPEILELPNYMLDFNRIHHVDAHNNMPRTERHDAVTRPE